ncbi:MAG: PIN domain-containing protein [Eubacteriales bacterium]|nr:PIN domain-containing protein [Eubacteriales bacterium]
MLKRFMRGISALMGALAGYGIYALVAYIGALAGYDFDKSLPNRERMLFRILAIVLFAIIFFISYPAFVRRTAKFSSNVSHDLKDVSMSTIVSGTIGLVAGLAIASLLTQLFKSVIKNRYIFDIVVIALYLGFGYIGIVVASVKGRDYVSGMRSLLRSQNQDGQGAVPSASGRTSRRHKDTAIPKVLDTSVIIDGRVADIMDAGFLEGPIVIPDFVLVELRHIADSADSLKRTRGRRGLDILNRIQKDYGVEIYNTEGEKALKEIPEVDVKLLRLAQIMNGKVVTNDYNLNKVAAIDEVPVLNINELANCLKPVVIPGETMKVHPVKQGKGHEQSIGYLDDGTMIVVENGADVIGKTVIIKVTSVIQTSAGRMIFGRVNESGAEIVED